MGEAVKIDRNFVLEHRTSNGGWNSSQLAALGVEWPPQRGWINRLVERELSQEQIKTFIRLGLDHRSKKAERRASAKKERSNRKAARKATVTREIPDAFLQSYEWRRVRMVVLKRDGAKCRCCGATPIDGRVMNVDHIKPRKHFPQLALDLNNLQVLCDVCNHGKGNWDETDWRQEFSEKSISTKLRVIAARCRRTNQ